MNCSVFKKIILIAALAVAFYVADAYAELRSSVCFDSACFYPDLARSAAEKQKGLMERGKLSETGGMLFIYDRPIRPAFWMKNMRISLDFVWLDEQGRVADLHQNIQPCGVDCPALVSREPIQYVLEIPAGAIEKNGIEIGDHAVIKTGERS